MSGLDKNVKLTNEQQKLIDAKLALLNTQQLQQDKIDAIIAKNAPDGLKKPEEEKKSISKVKKVIGVVSGKGGTAA